MRLWSQSYVADPADASALLATLRTFRHVCQDPGPRYDEERRAVLYWLDLDAEEARDLRCAEEAVRRELDRVVALHAAQLARPALRRRSTAGMRAVKP